MGDPHNKNRYGEQWPITHVRILQNEIVNLKDHVTISGGWAWCLLSPRHAEYKHAHDLKDIDVFIRPCDFVSFVALMDDLEYSREKTRYDHLSPFYRYVKYVPVGASTRKVIIDAFLAEVPSICVGEYSIVEPSYLLSLYGKYDPDSRLHGSGQCWSVQRAVELLDNQLSVVNHPKMGDFSRWIGKQ